MISFGFSSSAAFSSRLLCLLMLCLLSLLTLLTLFAFLLFGFLGRTRRGVDRVKVNLSDYLRGVLQLRLT